MAFRNPDVLRGMLWRYPLERDVNGSDNLTELMDILEVPAPTRNGKKRWRG